MIPTPRCSTGTEKKWDEGVDVCGEIDDSCVRNVFLMNGVNEIILALWERHACGP